MATELSLSIDFFSFHCCGSKLLTTPYDIRDSCNCICIDVDDHHCTHTHTHTMPNYLSNETRKNDEQTVPVSSGRQRQTEK